MNAFERRTALFLGSSLIVAAGLASFAQPTPPQDAWEARTSQARSAVDRQKNVLARLDIAMNRLLLDVCQLDQPALARRAKELEKAFDGFTREGDTASDLVAALRAYRVLQLQKMSSIASSSAEVHFEYGCVLQKRADKQLADLRRSDGYTQLNSADRAELERLIRVAVLEAGDSCTPSPVQDETMADWVDLPEIDFVDSKGDSVGRFCGKR